MNASDLLYARDMQAVAGIEKLRFFPLALQSGSGVWLVEEGGRKLLDLTSTWTAAGLGHGHPRITAAICRAAQAPAGAGGLSAVHRDSVGLAEELLALTPGTGERRVYLGHAGSDANDVVLRACRHATGRRRILAFRHGYHGGIGTAMRVSGVQIDAGVQADPDLYLARYPNVVHPHAGPDATPEAERDASLLEVERELARGDIACLMVEPILSDGGLIIPPVGFLAGLQALCRRYGVMLACDEVKVGLCRPGTMHAFEADHIVPDIVTFGKVLGGGLPLSAAVGPREILDGPPAAALLTTAGNPICTAAGREVLRVLVEEDMAARSKQAGERLIKALRQATQHMERVGNIRGQGLAIGLELLDGEGKPDRQLAQMVVYRAWELGVVLFYVGGHVLEITPPMTISECEIELAADTLYNAIRDSLSGVVNYDHVCRFSGW
ncbi:aspartate aminotransferase family protein [Komagataeibacter xylinus]|uniref:Aspartate aminotransferase family protein n=1 Tax=Komagataeibacter xylinus TaxID=28448 RepID=A0A318PP32_KOMXY|nr:aminotransferase class III-fold pyridoxal phosphate-dependent enzyme [Komagataeibacter xylinus]PYD57969.1 aspartate aminotransferase family protein [Komagataeibacter xylinus]GBQ73963.1 class III aminotransferase [Komagataeibacter xylinus NBRC 15237]